MQAGTGVTATLDGRYKYLKVTMTKIFQKKSKILNIRGEQQTCSKHEQNIFEKRGIICYYREWQWSATLTVDVAKIRVNLGPFS